MSLQTETPANETDIPSRDEVIKFYKEQNEILELRRDNARFQAEIAKHEADRYEEIAKLAHYQGMLSKASKADSPEGAKRELKKDN